MKKVFIIFGYKRREYEYLSFLKFILKKKNFIVMVRYMNFECYHDIYAWKPDFVILNQINQNENIDLAKYAKKSGATVVISNAELLWSEERLHIKYASDCNEYVDYTIECGDKNKYRQTVNYSHLDKKKIKMLGSPKLDCYLDCVRPNIEIKKPYVQLLNSKRNTICLCTSFLFSHTTWDEVKGNIAYQKIGKEQFEITMNAHKKLQKDFIYLAEKLSNTIGCNIIFRPHPLENKKIYEKVFKYRKNIILDNSVRQVELFQVVDLLIHRSSTMGTEAWMCDVPTISFDPIHSPRMELSDFTKLEKVFFTIPDVVSYCQSFLGKKYSRYISDKQLQFLKSEFGFDKKAKVSSSEKIAEFLSKLPVSKKTSVPHIHIAIYFILDFIRRICQKQYIYEIIGFVKGKEYIRKHKENYIVDNAN